MRVAIAIGSDRCRSAVRGFVERTGGLELVDVDSAARPLLARLGDRADVLVVDVVVASGRDSQLVIEAALAGSFRVAVMATVAAPNSRNLRHAGIAVHRVFDEESRERELRIMFRIPADRSAAGRAPIRAIRSDALRPIAPERRPVRAERPELIVVGASTGGPQALTRFLSGLPERLRVPILVVQHLADAPGASEQMARVIASGSNRQVVVPGCGVAARPGPVLLAPNGKHLTVSNALGRLALTESEPRSGCRPSVDELFESAARHYSNKVVAVLLTGMGSDGLAGCHMLHSAGSAVLVQDQASSAVWGMPGSVAKAGLADEILPLDDLARAVASRVGFAVRP